GGTGDAVPAARAQDLRGPRLPCGPAQDRAVPAARPCVPARAGGERAASGRTNGQRPPAGDLHLRARALAPEPVVAREPLRRLAAGLGALAHPFLELAHRLDEGAARGVDPAQAVA